MMTLRKAQERGHAQRGWLDSYHTFSFADYYDPEEMGFGALRVINDDRIAPGAGFPTHPHRDMEIVTYVLEGELEHKDSMGNGSTIRPGDVQRMTAGTGVAHSEFNPSPQNPVHLLQIWIEPKFTGLKPGYEQKHFDIDPAREPVRLIASPDGRDGSVTIHQDANVYALKLDRRAETTLTSDAGHKIYVHVARGSVVLNGVAMSSGDGAKLTGESALHFEQGEDAEILVFDLTR